MTGWQWLPVVMLPHTSRVLLGGLQPGHALRGYGGRPHQGSVQRIRPTRESGRADAQRTQSSTFPWTKQDRALRATNTRYRHQVCGARNG